MECVNFWALEQTSPQAPAKHQTPCTRQLPLKCIYHKIAINLATSIAGWTFHFGNYIEPQTQPAATRKTTKKASAMGQSLSYAALPMWHFIWVHPVRLTGAPNLISAPIGLGFKVGNSFSNLYYSLSTVVQ